MSASTENSDANAEATVQCIDLSKPTVTAPPYDLSQFEKVRVLQNNSNRKTVCVLGRFKNIPDDALLVLEKKAFTDSQLQTAGVASNSTDENGATCTGNDDLGYFSPKTKLRKEFQNDIYGNYECFPNPEINSVKTTIIHPATEKHIQKFSVQQIHIVQETPALYKHLTLPQLKREQFTLDWVYNILEHKKETERIVFEDPDPENGFVLLPDLKWDGKTLETLYLLAICHKRDIKSIRDLNESHLPLLRNILDKGVAAIAEKYGVQRSQLRIYCHYQPSFYHLHVHFTFLKHDAPGIFCEKSHLLDTIINNIELYPEYYERATLSFVVRETETLYEKCLEEGAFNKRARLV